MDCSGEEKAPSRELSRTELLKRAGVIGAAAAVPAALTTEGGQAREELAQLREMTTLSPRDATTIGAVCERLIPSDATGPGAKEANVIRYIDRALAGDLAVFRPAYVAGARAIDAYADLRFAAPFAKLTAERQDSILRDLEKNTLNKTQDPSVTREAGSGTPSTPEFTPSPAAVFEMIRTHALQGMFGDPSYGANTDFIGWKLVRFPGPRLVITANDQKLNVKPRTKLQSAYSMSIFRGHKITGVHKKTGGT
jgi:gluconate 2-dehydrogenase gamma chain